MYLLSLHPRPPAFDRPNAYATDYRMHYAANIDAITPIILNRVWSPIVWRDGQRRRENFRAARLAVIDVDAGLTLDEARAMCDGRAHIIATTKSHQKDKGGVICDRFRVVLFFDRTIKDLREYEYNVSMIQRRFRADVTKDGARFYWPSKLVVSAGAGVSTQVVLPPPDPPKRPLVVMPGDRKESLSRNAERAMVSVITNGQRHIKAIAIVLELSEKGWRQDEIVSWVHKWVFRGEDLDEVKRLVLWKENTK